MLTGAIQKMCSECQKLQHPEWFIWQQLSYGLMIRIFVTTILMTPRKRRWRENGVVCRQSIYGQGEERRLLKFHSASVSNIRGGWKKRGPLICSDWKDMSVHDGYQVIKSTLIIKIDIDYHSRRWLSKLALIIKVGIDHQSRCRLLELILTINGKSFKSRLKLIALLFHESDYLFNLSLILTSFLTSWIITPRCSSF